MCETGCTMYYVLPLTTKEYLIVTTLDSSLIIVVSKSCCVVHVDPSSRADLVNLQEFASFGEERERLKDEIEKRMCKNVNSLTSSLEFYYFCITRHKISIASFFKYI